MVKVGLQGVIAWHVSLLKQTSKVRFLNPVTKGFLLANKFARFGQCAEGTCGLGFFGAITTVLVALAIRTLG